MRDNTNIYPLNDKKKHTPDSMCACIPKILFKDGEMIFMHNSFEKSIEESLRRSKKISTACAVIEAELGGRINPNQEDIIKTGCKKHKVDESHIRLLLNIDAGRRSSRYCKTVK